MYPRRRFLSSFGATCLAMNTAYATRAFSGPITAYVGSYAPNGQGIYRFGLLPSSGLLLQEGLTVSAVNPSWLAIGGDRLYSADEHSGFEGQASGSVSTYAIGRAGVAPQLLGRVASGGAGPVHLSLHPSARHVFVANYGGGTVAVLPRAADGRLGAPTDMQSTTVAAGGALPGPAQAECAAPGSFARSGHDAPHAHMVASAPGGRFVVASDLGLDVLIVWRFDAERGRLLAPQVLRSSAGAGPRHFAFQPGQAQRLYVLNEEASTLAWVHMDAQTGALTARGEVSSLPPGFAGTSFASDLRFSRDGRFLYCLNRLHDSVAIFDIMADGAPRLLDHEWTRGSYPRSCAFVPDGRFLYVCNQRSDHISLFKVMAHGGLRFAEAYVPVGSPASIVFA